MNDVDHLFLEAAVEIAEQGRLTCSPNPPVGCVICKDGVVIGRGFHEKSGSPHAEINAVDTVAEGITGVRGSTVYVSLEPCAFVGKTPSCARSLSELGVERVVVAAIDPHPKVSGMGVKILREAGIKVDVFELGSASRLIDGFHKRVKEGRPFVRLKTASSLDGATSLSDGSSHWITAKESREDVQYWRARSDAVLTGLGTVLSDDPRLTVRSERYQKAQQPIRVIFDSHAKTPASSNALDESGLSLIVHSRSAEKQAKERFSDVDGVRCIGFEGDKPKVLEVLTLLADLGCNEVLVECGPRLIGSFLESGIWDEWLFYMAPKVLGNEANSLANIRISDVESSGVGRVSEAVRLGPDLRLTLQPN